MMLHWTFDDLVVKRSGKPSFMNYHNELQLKSCRNFKTLQVLSLAHDIHINLEIQMTSYNLMYAVETCVW